MILNTTGVDCGARIKGIDSNTIPRHRNPRRGCRCRGMRSLCNCMCRRNVRTPSQISDSELCISHSTGSLDRVVFSEISFRDNYPARLPPWMDHVMNGLVAYWPTLSKTFQYTRSLSRFRLHVACLDRVIRRRRCSKSMTRKRYYYTSGPCILFSQSTIILPSTRVAGQSSRLEVCLSGR